MLEDSSISLDPASDHGGDHGGNVCRQKRIVDSTEFDTISALLIMLNALSIGAQTEYMGQTRDAEVPFVFTVMETVFCFCFTFELVLRLLRELRTLIVSIASSMRSLVWTGLLL